MIIFDLDGVLADCEHRRHFVDPTKIINPTYGNSDWITSNSPEDELLGYVNVRETKKFKPDWQAFYEACDKDLPIESVISIFESLIYENHVRLGKEIEIWSGRCESVREKTEKWLDFHVWGSCLCKLKMRPIGDNTPDEQLKERWLDEYISSMWPKLEPVTPENEGMILRKKYPIEFVFDSDPKSVPMWRRRGIFVFDCNQTGKDF